MTFEDVLTAIANAYGLNSSELIGFSYEDEISGWDGGYGEWPVGSLWSVEGRILYALIRATKPAVVVEIGTNVGCGASHMASALKKNGTGQLMTFDIASSIVIPPNKAGESKVYPQGGLIPSDLLPFVELVNGDGIAFLNNHIGDVDFVFEDGNHSLESTRDAWVAALKKLNPGGFIVSHDAAHFLVGEAIQKGIAAAGVIPNVYAVQPSDCGVAIYRKPVEARVPYAISESIPLSAFVPNGDGDIVDFEYPFDKPKRQPQPDFASMSLRELKAYAEEHNIDLQDKRRKPDIITLLEDA